MNNKTPFAQSPLSGINFLTNVCALLQQTERLKEETSGLIKADVNLLANTIHWVIKRKSGRSFALRLQHIYSPIALTYVESDGHFINITEDLFAFKTPQEAADFIVKTLKEASGE
jgi:hypothetical protein